MSSQKYALITLILLVGSCCIFAQSQQPAEKKAIPIFDGHLPQGWKVGGWGKTQLQCQPVKDSDLSVLHLVPEEAAQNWSGGFLSTSLPDGQSKVQIELNEPIKKTGVLVLSINGSANEWGQHVGHQTLQLIIGQLTGKGKWMNGSKYLSIKPYINGGEIDEDAQTWQDVRIPLSKLLEAVDMSAIGSVFIQYVGAPTGPVEIRSIVIEY
jgi:hypothetical protein